MPYDPQRSRTRPQPVEAEPAPVEALLEPVAGPEEPSATVTRIRPEVVVDGGDQVDPGRAGGRGFPRVLVVAGALVASLGLAWLIVRRRRRRR